MRILLTGASGLLGQHLKVKADRPTHREMDLVDNPINWEVYNYYDLIIHCAAYTKVEQAEIDRLECFDVNVRGTLNLLVAYPQTPIVYISSEYAYKPVNFYSLTKYFAEELIKRHPNFLIIRTLFKPYPWPWEYAFRDQFTMGGYITDIAPLIDKEIMAWSRKGKKLIYIGDGQGRKSMLELARKTRPNIKPNSIKDMAVPIPADYV